MYPIKLRKTSFTKFRECRTCVYGWGQVLCVPCRGVAGVAHLTGRLWYGGQLPRSLTTSPSRKQALTFVMRPCE